MTEHDISCHLDLPSLCLRRHRRNDLPSKLENSGNNPDAQGQIAHHQVAAQGGAPTHVVLPESFWTTPCGSKHAHWDQVLRSACWGYFCSSGMFRVVPRADMPCIGVIEIRVA